MEQGPYDVKNEPVAKEQDWYLSQLKNEYVEQTTFVNTCKMYIEKHNLKKKKEKGHTQRCEEGNFAPRHEFEWEESE